MPTDATRIRRRVALALVVGTLLILAVLVGWAVLDAIAYRAAGQDATITQILRDADAGWPFASRLLSALAGGGFVLLVMHVWPGKPDEVDSPGVGILGVARRAEDFAIAAPLTERQVASIREIMIPPSPPAPPFPTPLVGPWEAVLSRRVPGMWMAVDTASAIRFAGDDAQRMAIEVASLANEKITRGEAIPPPAGPPTTWEDY